MAEVESKYVVFLNSSLNKPIVKSFMIRREDDSILFINNFPNSLLTNIAIMPNIVITIPITKRR